MISIPDMERPESCWQCYNEGCDHWAEYGYDNSAVCPLIEIDDDLISKFAEAYLEREAEDGNIHT